MRYNTRHYNAQRYNINGTFHASSLSEAVTPTEVEVPMAIKALADSISAADSSIVFASMPFFAEVIFAEDALRVDFTNKALADSVRLADWLSIRRYPFVNEWSN